MEFTILPVHTRNIDTYLEFKNQQKKWMHNVTLLNG